MRIILCLKSNFWCVFSVSINAEWAVVPWKLWCLWMNHQKNEYPSCKKTLPAWLNGWKVTQCLLNYFQYSSVTLLETFVLNTNCLNFDSVLTAYNFILENLPSVCKYKENGKTCSNPIIQLSSYILTTALLHIYSIFSWRFFISLFIQPFLFADFPSFEWCV